jgi:hypothetical protein
MNKPRPAFDARIAELEKRLRTAEDNLIRLLHYPSLLDERNDPRSMGLHEVHANTVEIATRSVDMLRRTLVLAKQQVLH